jgi:hypothetical protein
MVDVTIAAIEIAATGDLNENRVNVHSGRPDVLPIVPVEGSIVAARDVEFFGPDFFDQPPNRYAVDRGVESLRLIRTRFEGPCKISIVHGSTPLSCYHPS